MDKETIFNDIRIAMTANKTWGEPFYFKCFSDNILTYGHQTDGFYVELNIISDDTFWPTENPVELLAKTGISFFEYATYIFKDGNSERLDSKCYRPLVGINLN